MAIESLVQLHNIDLNHSDVVICATTLADASGLDALAYIRGMRPHVPVILTGDDASFAVEAIRGDTVNRTSGEVQRVVDGETVRSLALSGRNYLELASLIPGAITTDDDQMATMTGLGTGGTVINGNRGNSNSLTVDGGFNLDSGSNASMINNVSIDFIDQVAIQTSNFAADKGRNAGASINVVTRSGTNRFGGSLLIAILPPGALFLLAGLVALRNLRTGGWAVAPGASVVPPVAPRPP